MNAFTQWFDRNRKSIGYTVGAVNMISGLNYWAHGDMLNAVVWLILGAAIMFDTYEFK